MIEVIVSGGIQSVLTGCYGRHKVSSGIQPVPTGFYGRRNSERWHSAGSNRIFIVDVIVSGGIQSVFTGMYKTGHRNL